MYPQPQGVEVHGFGIVVRNYNGSPQILLQYMTTKAGYSGWSFPGGVLDRPEDSANEYIEGVKRKLQQACGSGIPPGLPELKPIMCNTMNSDHAAKTFVYHVFMVPDDEQWRDWQPRPKPGQAPQPVSGALVVDNKHFYYNSSTIWIDFISLARELVINKNSRTALKLHLGVGSWFQSNAESVSKVLNVDLNAPNPNLPASVSASGQVADTYQPPSRGNVCTHYAKGFCALGNRCKFLHSPNPMEAITPTHIGSSSMLYSSQPPAVDLARGFVIGYMNSFNASPYDTYKLYNPNAALSFDGKLYMGTQSIQEEIWMFMQCGFRQMHFDVESITSQYTTNATGVLVGVPGNIIMETSAALPFYQTFLLVPSLPAGNWAIANHLLWLLKT